MATKKRVKAVALGPVPQTKDEAAADISEIGRLQRERDRMVARMNDEIGRIAKMTQPFLERIEQQLATLTTGVQTWAEANRDQLTNGGKVKTANLVTGEIAWRNDPPSVSVRNAEVVLKTMAHMGLQAYIRTVSEVNKEAILAAFNAARTSTLEQAARDPELARVQGDVETIQGISGITIRADVEKFVITPFELDAQSNKVA